MAWKVEEGEIEIEVSNTLEEAKKLGIESQALQIVQLSSNKIAQSAQDIIGQVIGCVQTSNPTFRLTDSERLQLTKTVLAIMMETIEFTQERKSQLDALYINARREFERKREKQE